MRFQEVRRFLFVGILPCLILAAGALQAEPIAIIGGQENTETPDPISYVALVSSTGVTSALTGPALPVGDGYINSVAMAPSGAAIIGGQDNTETPDATPYVALVSPTGVTTALTGPALPMGDGYINSVAIAPSGAAIIGGQDSAITLNDTPYAALVSPAGVTTALTGPALPMGDGYINSVAIAPSGAAIIGGQDINSTAPYTALVSPAGVTTALTGPALPIGDGSIYSVAIAPSGAAIIGGQDHTNTAPYAALVSPTGITTALTGPALPMGDGYIVSVAIAPSGAAIIGGQDSNSTAPYAALVSPTGVTTALTGPALPVGAGSQIHVVAIAPSGAAIIGGQDYPDMMNATPYAALVSPTGVTTALTGPGLPMGNGQILSVAIASSGAAIIGGQHNTTVPYVALVSPTGVTTALTGVALPTGEGQIYGVSVIGALVPLLSNIPTASLSGNNLIYANYINEFASQDAFYFVPAVLDGTLAAALESAAPTRNALSLFTASNNLFNLTTSFANHIRNQSGSRVRKNKGRVVQTSNTSAVSEAKIYESEEQLLASVSLMKSKSKKNSKVQDGKRSPYTIWFDAVGLLAHQKAQSQTPAFKPSAIGAILAFDAMVGEDYRVGGGATYLFTHIHENQGAGHSNINQEDVFVYASWDNQSFYVDGLLMAGPVQITQVRNIQMTGFNFKASSDPNGWQMIPHLELGYNNRNLYRAKSVELLVNPFAMLDWANAWQGSYKEKGNGPFNAAQKAHHSSLLRTEVGLRVFENIFFDSGNLIFQEKGSYVNTQSFGAGKVNAFLVGSPGSFTVETLASAQNLGALQLSMIFDPLNACYPTSTIFYQGEFGMQYQSHQVNLEFAWSF